MTHASDYVVFGVCERPKIVDRPIDYDTWLTADLPVNRRWFKVHASEQAAFRQALLAWIYDGAEEPQGFRTTIELP